MFYSPSFTYLIVYFCQFLIIDFYWFTYSNKGNIFNVALNLQFFFGEFIKGVDIVEEMRDWRKRETLWKTLIFW